jgi:hypothetical protein
MQNHRFRCRRADDKISANGGLPPEGWLVDGFRPEVWAAFMCIEFGIKAASQYDFSMTDQSNDSPLYWVGQIGPPGNYCLQIRVK